MGLVFWSMGAISPRLYTVPFQQEPALGQWSLVMLGAACCIVLQSTVLTCCPAHAVTFSCMTTYAQVLLNAMCQTACRRCCLSICMHVTSEDSCLTQLLCVASVCIIEAMIVV